MPVFMAWPLAATSTQCASLVELLNTQRLLNLKLHDRLQTLETALRQLNKGKGLGFMVKGRYIVLDTRILQQVWYT